MAEPAADGGTARDLTGELLDLLLQALKELGDAGQADQASRLAAAAYVRLRKQDPKQAQRINVLMHRLAARMSRP